MIPNYGTYTKITSETISHGTAGIRATPVMYYTLMSGIAKNKIKYFLQELGSNAWDTKTSFEVFLPTIFKPVFRIRDCGPGLSHDDVVNVFCEFGNSTKDNDADSQGHRGLGSKSPYGYLINGTQLGQGAGSFTVRSFFDGMVRTYTMAIQPDGKPGWDLIDESPTDEPTGLEVSFPIRREDIDKVRWEAQSAYWGFRPRPKIYPEIDFGSEVIAASGDGWVQYQKDTVPFSGPRVRMGCILFPVDMAALDMPDWPWRRVPILFDVPLGSLTPTTSNEELGYDATTKQTLMETIKAFELAYVVELQDHIDTAENFFEACVLFHDRTNTMPSGAAKHLESKVLYRGKTPIVSTFKSNHDEVSACVFNSDQDSPVFDRFSEGRGKANWSWSIGSYGAGIRSVIIQTTTSRSFERITALKPRLTGRVLWLRCIGKDNDHVDAVLGRFGLTRTDPAVFDLGKVKLPKIAREGRSRLTVKKKSIFANGEINDVSISLKEGGIYVVDREVGSRTQMRNRNYLTDPNHTYNTNMMRGHVGEILRLLKLTGYVDEVPNVIIFDETPKFQKWTMFGPWLKQIVESKMDFDAVARGKRQADALDRSVENLKMKANLLVRRKPIDFAAFLTKVMLHKSGEDKSDERNLYNYYYKFTADARQLVETPSPAQELGGEYELLREKYKLLHRFVQELGYYNSNVQDLDYYLDLEARAAEHG
jgi:hypothetical protein